MELIPIRKTGRWPKSAPQLPDVAAQVIKGTRKLYRAAGYEPPWICYFAVEGDTCVGTCGFKSPPENNRAEIAYFTFPEHESKGVATRMAAELIRLAREATPSVTVAAQTLPGVSASSSVLKKLGFQLIGTDEDADVGLVWEWRLLNTSQEG
ncbi:MAG TPA: GNAT family protein [Pyrinomonadaceae bacterium]|nr:GNAT family protein [Pyrinomonadaceae bacterium]